VEPTSSRSDQHGRAMHYRCTHHATCDGRTQRKPPLNQCFACRPQTLRGANRRATLRHAEVSALKVALAQGVNSRLAKGVLAEDCKARVQAAAARRCRANSKSADVFALGDAEGLPRAATDGDKCNSPTRTTARLSEVSAQRTPQQKRKCRSSSTDSSTTDSAPTREYDTPAPVRARGADVGVGVAVHAVERDGACTGRERDDCERDDHAHLLQKSLLKIMLDGAWNALPLLAESHGAFAAQSILREAAAFASALPKIPRGSLLWRQAATANPLLPWKSPAVMALLAIGHGLANATDGEDLLVGDSGEDDSENQAFEKAARKCEWSLFCLSIGQPSFFAAPPLRSGVPEHAP